MYILTAHEARKLGQDITAPTSRVEEIFRMIQKKIVATDGEARSMFVYKGKLQPEDVEALRKIGYQIDCSLLEHYYEVTW